MKNWHDDFATNAFDRARQVAACPHNETCQADFRGKGESRHPPEHWYLASTPSPDFIGAQYRGLVIIGGNPGIAHREIHHKHDRQMFKLQDRVARGDRNAFEELMRFLPRSMEHWPQMVDTDGRRRMGYDIEDVAYIDIVKCGTRPGKGDTHSLFQGTPILGRCWENHTKPLLDLLQPTHIVALWKPIISVLSRLDFVFDGPIGFYNGARHLTKEKRYAGAATVFGQYYGDLKASS